MKKNMSALDIKVCIEELEEVLNAWVGKIYEINYSIFIIKLNPPEKKKQSLVIEPGRRIHLSQFKYKTPDHPPSFAMLLRKYLSNTKLIGIKQPDMERIVKMKLGKKDAKYTLIAELFGEGNLILCEQDERIIQPWKTKLWKDRKIKTGEKYSLPPKKGKNIEKISEKELEEIISEGPDLVRGLARNLNIGGDLAEEICAISGLDKETTNEKLSSSDYDTLYSSIRKLMTSTISPLIIYDNNTPVDVLPFSFKTKSKYSSETFDSFNQALDHYFQKISEKKADEIEEEKLEEEINSLKSRLNNQKKHLENLKSKASKKKKKADMITKHHEKIDYALDKINQLRKSKGWEAVKNAIGGTKDIEKSWKGTINSINPEKGIIELKLPEDNVEVDIRRSSFENASKLYEKSKKMKNKIEGAKKAIQKTRKEIDEIKEKGLETPPEPVSKIPREKRWYERYRWFFTSEDELVIAGRDAKTNKEVVEKHMEKNDLYFHADFEGAPHTVLKRKKDNISEKSKREAAKFAGINSRAWREGLANVDVYSVKPEQVTEEPPSGEYLPKGGYMIKGDRNYLTIPLEAALGVIKRKDSKILMCGPPEAVAAKTDNLVKVKPGPIKKSNLTKKIKDILEKKVEIEVNIDDLMRILPPGPGMLVD